MKRRNNKKQRIIDVTVKNMDPKDLCSHPEPYHPHLPKHEFSMIVVAPKGSGKTNLLVNLLMHHYKEFFHKILVCSPTIDNDPKWDLVKDTKHILKENKKLNKILYQQADDPHMHRIIHDTPEDIYRNQIKEKHDKFDGKIPADCFFSDMDEVIERVKDQQDQIEIIRDLGHDKQSKFIADRMLIILDDQVIFSFRKIFKFLLT